MVSSWGLGIWIFSFSHSKKKRGKKVGDGAEPENEEKPRNYQNAEMLLIFLFGEAYNSVLGFQKFKKFKDCCLDKEFK